MNSEAYIHIVGVGDSASYTNSASGFSPSMESPRHLQSPGGKHLFKLGMDERHIVSNIHPAALSVQADFFDLDSMLNNSVSALVVTRTRSGEPGSQ